MNKSREALESMKEERAGNRDLAARAYELWKKRGCPEGSAEEDWREAEREIELVEGSTQP